VISSNWAKNISSREGGKILSIRFLYNAKMRDSSTEYTYIYIYITNFFLEHSKILTAKKFLETYFPYGKNDMFGKYFFGKITKKNRHPHRLILMEGAKWENSPSTDKKSFQK